MPIGLGLASSHAPALVAPLEQWEPLYERFTGRVTQPPQAALETEEVIRGYIERIDHAFGTLREQLAAYRPDLLIVIGGDQSEMFDRSNVPNLMIHLDPEAWASWGNMLTRATQDLSRGPWLVYAPGAAIFLTVLCLYLVGDGLRDALDPRLSNLAE